MISKRGIVTLIFSILFIFISSSYCLIGVSDEDLVLKSIVNVGDYGVQWEKSYGSVYKDSARYEGPQPIGDCDNDGDNELLIGGRECVLHVMEWNATKQTYEETHLLYSPPCHSGDIDWFFDSSGFAIGDLTGDGKNEIVVSWVSNLAVYKWMDGGYQVIGWNWTFFQCGPCADCYIGDYDTDGQNEVILSCRDWTFGSEIVIFGWKNGVLAREAEWDDPGILSRVYRAGIGDPDLDDENEIICGAGSGVVVLDWNRHTQDFECTVIQNHGPDRNDDHPYACVCRDSDGDGIDEIHVGYEAARISVFEWNVSGYKLKYEKEWPGEGMLIEGLDVGDADDDNMAEIVAGTHHIHILQWNGFTYVEESVITHTFGDLAVVATGDCDNDGKNEIHAGSVDVEDGEDYMAWVFKLGWGQ